MNEKNKIMAKVVANLEKVYDPEMPTISVIHLGLIYDIEIVERVVNNFSKIENIKKFFSIKEKFSIENGMLTPTLKLKRYKIINKYKKDFEKLY